MAGTSSYQNKTTLDTVGLVQFQHKITVLRAVLLGYEHSLYRTMLHPQWTNEYPTRVS